VPTRWEPCEDLCGLPLDLTHNNYKGSQMRTARGLTPAVSPLALLALAATLFFSIGGVVPAQPKPATAVAEDQRLLPYVKPGQLVDIGGRRINLHCTGTGSPTVILMSGSSSWSVVWYLTQPEIAKRARVCAFDRASFGFSDPAPKPPTMSEAVSDLHAALKAADIPGPYVLVGHSLGGVEARLFAERWPQEVAGMVLVDTSPAAEFLIEVNLPGFDEAEGFEGFTTGMLRCALLEAHGPLDPSNAEYAHCSLGPLPADTPAALRKMWPSFFTTDYWIARFSQLSSLWTHRYDSVDHLDLGDRPLVVLSADDSWGLTDGPAKTFWRNYRKQWFAQHEALAHLSSRGVHRVIDHTGHMIQLEKPQAVIDAVDEVLRQVRAGAQS
jgi:pimeloyl-ACP methyl ester carboxylesterase